MKLLKKPVSIAVGTVILSAIALVYSINLLADIKRDLVYEEIQKVVGKDVQFDDFDVTVLSGLGFSAKEFRIADRPIFAATPLMRAKELRMGVSVLSLLLGRIVINKLTLIEPEFQIITNESGLMNVSSLEERRKQLVDLPRSRSSSKREANSVTFLITKLRIMDGRIDFIDRSVRAPAEMRINNVEMEITGINPNGRAKMTLAAALNDRLDQDIRIEGYLGPFARGSGWKEQPVEVSVEFDSLFVPLLTRAVPFFRNKIPPELDIAGPLSVQAELTGVLARPQIARFVVKAPMLGSSEYNAVLSGSADLSKEGQWSTARLKGNLRLNSVNIARLRKAAVFQELLPDALTGEGQVSVDTLFEGTWDTLRLGTVVQAGETDIHYSHWLRKPSGVKAEWSSRISRQKNRFTVHESVLTLGNARINLSGTYERGVRPRLQINASTGDADLAQLMALFPSLQSYRVKGRLRTDLQAWKDIADANAAWNIRGKLGVSDAELKKEGSQRPVQLLNADLNLAGRQARLEKVVFRVGSSQFEMKGHLADLAKLALNCEIRAADLNLIDLADFPVAQSDRLKNLLLAGELGFDGARPVLRGTLSSSHGTLQDISYQNLRAEMAWSQEETSFKNFSFRALGGTWRNREVWISGAWPTKRLEFYSQLSSVDLQSLLAQRFASLKDRIEGQLNLQGEIHAEAHNGKMTPASLKGSGEAQIRQGTLKNFNLIALLLSRVETSTPSAVSIQLSPSLTELAKPKDTPFETLEAEVTLEPELVRTDNLLLSTLDYSIHAAGWIMIDHTTRWNGVLVMSPRISKELLRENKSLRYILDRRGQITLPFRAEGSLASLKVRPDTRAIAQILRRGSLPKTIEPPPVDKRQEKQEQKESLPAELEQFLSR